MGGPSSRSWDSSQPLEPQEGHPAYPFILQEADMGEEKKTFDDREIAADDVGATAMAQRAKEAMAKTHDEQAGSAECVGSVGFDEDGAFEVGSEDPDENERRAPGA